MLSDNNYLGVPPPRSSVQPTKLHHCDMSGSPNHRFYVQITLTSVTDGQCPYQNVQCVLKMYAFNLICSQCIYALTFTVVSTVSRWAGTPLVIPKLQCSKTGWADRVTVTCLAGAGRYMVHLTVDVPIDGHVNVLYDYKKTWPSKILKLFTWCCHHPVDMLVDFRQNKKGLGLQNACMCDTRTCLPICTRVTAHTCLVINKSQISFYLLRSQVSSLKWFTPNSPNLG